MSFPLVEDIDVIARLDEVEILAGVTLKGILARGKAMNLVVHFPYLGLIGLDLLFLGANLEASPDPTDHAVGTEETHEQNEESGYDNGVTDERALLGVLPVPACIPKIFEPSHYSGFISAKIVKFAEQLKY